MEIDTAEIRKAIKSAFGTNRRLQLQKDQRFYEELILSLNKQRGLIKAFDQAWQEVKEKPSNYTPLNDIYKNIDFSKYQSSLI